MRYFFLLLCAFLFCQLQTHAVIDTLFEDDFSGGDGNWSLTGGVNSWIVNDVYYCGGILPISNPNIGGGNYMHVYTNSGVPTTGGLCCCYNTSGSGEITASLKNVLDASSYDTVSISFDWFCRGFDQTAYGYVDYSTDGGSSYVRIKSPDEYLSGESDWLSITITSDATQSFFQTPNLKFRFGFVNGMGIDPAFAVDNVVITGTKAVVVPTELEISLIDSADVLCNGDSTGMAEALATGGRDPYAYQWYTSAGVTVSGANTAKYSSFSAGSYYCVVFDMDVDKDTAWVTIDEAPELLLDTANLTHITCALGSTGSINIVATGGTPPYTYNIDGGSFQPSATFSPLTAGTYSFIIRDDNGCELTFDKTITQQGSVMMMPVVVDEGCLGDEDGSIDISVVGGTPPYQFSINGGVDWDNDSVFTGLAPNSYDIQVKDDSACVSSAIRDVNKGDSIAMAYTVEQPKCFGDSGEIVFLADGASGGTPPFTFSSNGGSFQSDTSFSGLPYGAYIVTIKDNNNCTVTLDTAIINPPDFLIDDTVFTNPGCDVGSTGSIEVVVSGGVPPYRFYKNGTGQQSTGVFPSLLAGTYTINILDANDCDLSFQKTLTKLGSAVINPILTPETCYDDEDGSINIPAATGGVPPYQYSIDSGKTWSSTTQYLNREPRTYYIQVKDAADCVSEYIGVITKADSIELDIKVVSPNCYGDSGEIIFLYNTTTGGTTPYTLDGASFQSDITYSDLPAGDYIAIIVDANGCSDTLDTAIVSPPEMTLQISTSDEQCSGDSNGIINVTVSGAPANYSFIIEDTDSSIQQTLPGCNFTDLPPGSYTVNVVDGNDCSKSKTALINAAADFTLDFDVVNETCQDETDGTITVTREGGTPPYYNLDCSPSGTVADTVIMDLTAREYYVMIKDAKDCIAKDTVEVSTADCSCSFFMPTGFNPNSSILKNTVFRPVTDCKLKSYQLVVYNRWSVAVFESNDINISWDGKLNGKDAPGGVYIWTIYYENLLLPDEGMIKKRGTISLLR